MSRALFERAADGRHGAEAAGTQPAERLHPAVVEAMAEIGIDLAERRRSCSPARWPSRPTSW